MARQKTKLIFNPKADLGRALHLKAGLEPMVEEMGGADWSETAHPAHAVELAHHAADEGFELVIACGGDGTVHEVINGLMQVPAEKRPRLGIVPLGSGNDFSSAVGIDSNPTQAVRQAYTGTPHQVDVGVLRAGNERCEYWDNTLGIGFDTTVTIRSRKIPVLRGFLIYLIAVLQTILLNHDAAGLQVKTDLESWDQESLMLVLCNGGREGGGFCVSPKAQVSDGILNYTGICKVSRPMMLRLLPEVMRGTHERFPQVRSGQFHSLELESDRPLYIHTDGEIFAGLEDDVRRLSVEILPGAIEVVS